MDTQKIKAVLSAVEHKSLSKAAEEFSYTPSAFSHIADSLEKELGVKLLVRTHLGVELSEEGKRLYDKMQAVINAERKLLEEVQKISGKKCKQLHIGTYSSISVHMLPEILREFKEIHTEINISITVGDSLKDWLNNGTADIIFAQEGGNTDNEWFPIIKDDFVAVVPESEFSDNETIKCEELYKYPFIKTNEHYVNSFFDQTKFNEIINVESVDDMSVVSMVREGMGVAILPSLVLKNQTNGVRTLKLEPEISRTLGFSYKRDADRTSAKMEFVQYLKKKFKLH